MFTIIFTTGLSYFTFISSEDHNYQTNALDRSANDRHKGLEKFTVTTKSNSGNLGFYINNTGAVSIRLIALFVSNDTHTLYYNQSTAGPSLFPIFLNPLSGSSLLDTGIVLAQGAQYELTALSDKGGISTGNWPEEASTISVVALAIGFITMDFDSLRWAIWSQDSTLETLAWSNSPNVPTTQPIVWKATFNNNLDKDLYLGVSSIVSAQRATIQTGGQQNEGGGGGGLKIYWYYIVNSPDFGPYADNTLVIPAGGPAEIVFGSASMGAGVSSSETVSIANGHGGSYMMFIVLHGNWSSPAGPFYGQNIPFGGFLVT